MAAMRFALTAGSMLMLLAVTVAASEADVLLLQQQRAQQQMELQLRMQQQQERATRPSPDAAAEAQRRQFEIGQQQRLHQFNDAQSRAGAAQSRGAATDRATDAQMRRLATQPRLNTDRSLAGAR